jgi:tol-pal system protein YbgF
MHRLIALLSLGVGVTVMTGCASTPPDEDPVQIKLNNLDARTTRIERVVSNQSLLELAQRVDSLQNEVRTLRGQIDELQNANEALRKQQRDLYADLEKRIAQAAPPAPTAPPAAAASGSAAGEQAAYVQALDALRSGKYPAAIAAFRQFGSSYPQSNLADNAQYWLGEAYYVSRDYQSAASAFRTVIDQWPSSRKAPDALLKLGFSQYELKHYTEARATLTDVTHRFPDSDAARLATERLRHLSDSESGSATASSSANTGGPQAAPDAGGVNGSH